MEAEKRSLKDLIKDYAEWKSNLSLGKVTSSEIEYLERIYSSEEYLLQKWPTNEVEQDCSTPLLEDL